VFLVVMLVVFGGVFLVALAGLRLYARKAVRSLQRKRHPDIQKSRQLGGSGTNAAGTARMPEADYSTRTRRYALVICLEMVTSKHDGLARPRMPYRCWRVLAGRNDDLKTLCN